MIYLSHWHLCPLLHIIILFSLLHILLLRAFLEFTPVRSERIVRFHTRAYRSLRRTTFRCQTLLVIWPLTKSCSEKWSYVGFCRLSYEISQLSRCGPV